MNDDLDTLLRAPLPEIPDHGFSDRIVARIETEKNRDTMLSRVVIGLCVLAPLPFLPGNTVSSLVPAISNMLMQPGLYIAAAVIALTLLAERELSQA